MRFLVLGGTGPCGILIIRQLLATYPDSTIIVYARNPHKLPSDLSPETVPRIQVIQGDLTDDAKIEKSLEGIDVVLSALGPAYGHPNDTPLAKGYELVIDAMHKHGVSRLIALGTSSIVDPNDQYSFAYSCMIAAVKVGANSAYRDIVAIGKVIREKGADLDWTIVRVPVLTNQESTAVVAGYVGDGRVRTYLSRKAFAVFVVGEIENRGWIKKAPLITAA